MCRVKSFLGCISLETFGLFLGWTGFVLGIVIAVPLMFLIVFGLSEFGRVVIGVCIITLVLCCLFVYVCLELINGIETRDHEKVESFKNFCIFAVAAVAVLLIDCLYHILKPASFPAPDDTLIITPTEKQPDLIDPIASKILIAAFVYWLSQIYTLICVHSLYKKFVEEKYPSLMKSSP